MLDVTINHSMTKQRTAEAPAKQLMTNNRMVAFGDLPPAAVELICQLARGRIIPGTNRYARISRQWREADSSSSGDAHPMQLLVDLAHLPHAELRKASDWLLKYGQHVEVLVVAAGNSWQQVDFTPKVAPALTRLRRLEVEQPGSLVHLVPVLGQLPQLQHLAAHVSLVLHSQAGNEPPGGSVEGVFTNQGRGPWTTVPDLEQLCPQLVSLHLTITTDGGYRTRRMDDRLPRLLPGRLQQLILACHAYSCALLPSSLSHLQALQELTLHGVGMVGPGAAELGSQLVALQQLRLLEPPVLSFVLELASKVTAHSGYTAAAHCAAMVHLTSLRWRLPGCVDTSEVAPIVQALAALTGLQELELSGLADNTAIPLVQHIAGMASLRSLQLRGEVTADEEEGLHDSLAKCTQLTSLALGFRVRAAPGGNIGFRRELPVPLQLTGLQRLSVRHELLQQGLEGGCCLVDLTQLTRLHVLKPDEMYGDSPPVWDTWVAATDEGRQQIREQYMPGVQQQLEQRVGWPASMQQVVLDMPEHPDIKDLSIHCGTFTPVTPNSRQVTVWLEPRRGMARGWARPLRPCPHLPGIWELQGEVEDRVCLQKHWWA
jgi:hypothetical protein